MCPIGIHAGLGSPCPCFEVNRRPNRPRLVKHVIELSRVCITSVTIVCSDQWRRLVLRSVVPRLRRFAAIQASQRGRRSPSTSAVANSPMALLPCP